MFSRVRAQRVCQRQFFCVHVKLMILCEGGLCVRALHTHTHTHTHTHSFTRIYIHIQTHTYTKLVCMDTRSRGKEGHIGSGGMPTEMSKSSFCVSQ
jgi:hypothetical protein